MSTEQAAKEWNETKGKIKSKWSKFVDTDIEKFKDNMDLIAEKVQHAYGYTKDKAEQEYKDFKKSLSSTVQPIEKPKVN